MTSNSVESGSFGRGGDRPAAVRMEFFGVVGGAFVSFALERARRLNLRGWIADGGNRVTAHVEGAEALVGAFEMALCLGPVDANVRDWTCAETFDERDLDGFRARQA